MKKAILSLGVLAALMTGSVGMASAASSTVNFAGKILPNTCDVSVNGTVGTTTVTLPYIALPDMPTTAGSVSASGRTPFTIGLSNCSGGLAAGEQARIKFVGTPDAAVTTAISNTGTSTGGAIYIATAAAPAVALDPTTGEDIGPNTAQTAAQLEALTLPMVAGYISTSATPTVGTALGQVEFVYDVV
ncbi:fimbrial protein [Serratia fonticola]|uniref:fimbrial protein n=1 Tax=Serratia fonticola TaxID=47917 RepID=UPI00301D4407